MKWAAPASGVTYIGACITRSSGTQTIANQTQTTILFPGEEWDTDGFHDNVNTSRLTVPSGKAGKYHLTCQIQYNSNASGLQLMYLFKNGNVYGNGFPGGSQFSYYNGTADMMFGSATVNAVANDYFEVLIYHSSGGNRDIGFARCSFDYLGA